MRDDPDHLDRLRLRSANADEDALSYCGFARKCFGGEKLVDHDNASPRRIVILTERAAFDKRGSERFEVTRKNNLEVNSLKFGGIGQRRFGTPADRTEASG